MRWSRLIPSRRWLILPPVLLGVAIVAGLAASRQELNRIELSESAVPVDFISVSKAPMHPQIVAFGSAEPNRRWMAVAEVAGRVASTRANLESGVPVREGELLVSIDRSDYELRLEQREADLRQAKSQLVQLNLNKASDTESLSIQRDLLSVRKNEVTRLQSLQLHSATSESALDGARAAMLQQRQSVQTLVNSLSTYDAQIEAAEAAIALGESRVKEAQRDLERTQMFSPFNGLLFGVELEQGQYVAFGQTLFEVIDISWVEVEAQVSMAQWSQVLRLMEEGETPGTIPRSTQPDWAFTAEGAAVKTPSTADDDRGAATPYSGLQGLTAVLTVRNGENRPGFVGTPIRLTSTLDVQTRTMGVVIRVDNPGFGSGVADGTRTLLRPGTYCEVSMRSRASVPAFRVPRSSIEDGTVLCIGSDNRLRRRRVVVAFAQEEYAAVIAGLSEADRVVVNPPAMALDGQLTVPVLSTEFNEMTPVEITAQ